MDTKDTNIPQSKTPLLDFFQEVEYRHELITNEVDHVLRKRGWTHTSSTPGCLWMWEKKLPDGRTILTNRECAMRFEQELCGEMEFVEGGE